MQPPGRGVPQSRQRRKCLMCKRWNALSLGPPKPWQRRLNALTTNAASPLDICASGEDFIVFRHGESSIGAVTDAKQRLGFSVDPPGRKAYPPRYEHLTAVTDRRYSKH